jgi:multicopper oxidase
VLTQEKLKAAPEVALPAKEPDRVYRLELTGGMEKYDWGINGIRFNHDDPLAPEPLLVAMGERVRLEFVNTTKMWHPMHLHGHTFQIGASGARKDTVIVVPEQEVVCDFDADNPGQWMIHCHNTYHAESGMMRVLGYTS